MFQVSICKNMFSLKNEMILTMCALYSYLYRFHHYDAYDAMHINVLQYELIEIVLLYCLFLLNYLLGC